MLIKNSIKINKKENGIYFEIKNLKPIVFFPEKGNPNKDMVERPYYCDRNRGGN